MVQSLWITVCSQVLSFCSAILCFIRLLQCGGVPSGHWWTDTVLTHQDPGPPLMALLFNRVSYSTTQRSDLWAWLFQEAKSLTSSYYMMVKTLSCICGPSQCLTQRFVLLPNQLRFLYPGVFNFSMFFNISLISSALFKIANSSLNV